MVYWMVDWWWARWWWPRMINGFSKGLPKGYPMWMKYVYVCFIAPLAWLHWLSNPLVQPVGLIQTVISKTPSRVGWWLWVQTYKETRFTSKFSCRLEWECSHLSLYLLGNHRLWGYFLPFNVACHVTYAALWWTNLVPWKIHPSYSWFTHKTLADFWRNQATREW